ncbi:MAG: phage tail tape measure protein [Nitrospirae bacterium]|nr:MAG: phage tail tape measure protein [Nitrospirota bacterium]
MKLFDLLPYFVEQLTKEREVAMSTGPDAPLVVPETRRIRTVGSLHVYALSLDHPPRFLQDVPLTILPGNELEPTEGSVLSVDGSEVLIQAMDAFGDAVPGCTCIADTSGFLETVSGRLQEMSAKPESFTLGPAERLAPWLSPETRLGDEHHWPPAPPSVLSIIWEKDPAIRRAQLGAMAVEAVRQNKRMLLLAPDHHSVDDLVAVMARALRTAALPYQSLLSRYEFPLRQESLGIKLQELGFETYMFQFSAKANAHKSTLRKKYDRFRELTPLLAYKREKQKDLNEVKLLEWRLLTQLSEWQAKIRNIDKIVAEYEAIPIWKRLAMQAAGKNVETLAEYRVLYEQKIQALMREVEIAQQRIRELTSEAAIPKDLRPEYEELKEEIARLGGTQKIREMLAAGEGTNRQAFAQNKRLLATTAGRVVCDPLFRRLRFDLLIVDDATSIPAPLLLGAAGMIRERIVLGARPSPRKQVAPREEGSTLWTQHIVPIETPLPAQAESMESSAGF